MKYYSHFWRDQSPYNHIAVEIQVLSNSETVSEVTVVISRL